MPASENKTKPTKESVSTHINSIKDDALQKDAKTLLKLFKEVTGAKAILWGDLIGFGKYHYKYDSGREGDSFATGFAIRKSGPTIYIMPGYTDYSHILKDLGPHKLGKSCLYLKSLKDIDLEVLKKLIKVGLKDLRTKYPVVL
jgi:hypothetical protein